MSPPSRSAVRTAASELRPGVAVTDVTVIEAGKNDVYAVSFADRETVLKVGTAAPDRVRAEPAILRFVRDRTAVPVPAVLGAADDVLDHPCCLLERVPGRTVPDRPTDLAVGVLARLCEEAGRHLAALHGVGEFEGFGPLVPGDDGVTVGDPDADWPSLLGRAMDAKIEALGARFEQYGDALRTSADAAVEECRRSAPFDPALVHMDYRPANLVFDPGGSPVTRTVLDWAGAAAAPAAYEVAHAEALLADWPRLDGDDRATLRARFRAGYAPARGPLDVPDAYRVDARLRLMKHFDVEVGDRDEAAVQARADDHVEALDSLGVLSE